MFQWQGNAHEFVWGPWSWMPIFPLLGLVIALLFLWNMFGRRGCHPFGHPTSHDATNAGPSPLDVAKLRYARGEITREEYEDIKRTIA